MGLAFGAMGMSEILVECYAGYRADERPERFTLRGKEFVVSEVDGQWYSPASIYFRVLANDGNYYVLRHDEVQDSWTLDAFRAARANDVVEVPCVRPVVHPHSRVL